MSDSDRSGKAWLVSPSEYIEKRPAIFGLPAKPRSQYLAMRDGCQLAVDCYLPQRGAGEALPARLPTIVILTPYYRRFKLRAEAATTTEASPSAAKYRDVFVPRGYALLVVDVRGTGASFGSRDSFRSPAEREDYREIADWIVAQPWSNGVIGATGVSYVGAACDFLAGTGHPAVKAIAPLFAVWDTYSNHYYPGGLLLTRLATSYDALMIALDHDRRDLLSDFPYFNNPDFAGPAPVDADEDGALCREAVREHLANFHMPEFIAEFRFKDDALPYDPTFTSGSFSPYLYSQGVRPDVAVYSVSGWMDGAGFTNGAIARFLTLPNVKRHLLVGPWDHGARTNVSPDRDGADAQFPLLAEVLRFFDQYLMGRDTGLEREAPVHYFTMRGEAWRPAQSWPPVAEQHKLFLAGGGRLLNMASIAGAESYKVDFSRGTGSRTRYERLAAVEVKDYYSDWHGRDDAMLRYTSAPFEARRLSPDTRSSRSISLAISRMRRFISISRRSRRTAPAVTSPKACCARFTENRCLARRTIARAGPITAAHGRMRHRSLPARSRCCALPCCRPRGRSAPAACCASPSLEPISTTTARCHMAVRRTCTFITVATPRR